MIVNHRLVGYDRRTDRATQSFDVADRVLPMVKRIAQVPEDDPNAAWSYPLASEQVRQVADLIGATVDPESAEFFLEAFAAV